MKAILGLQPSSSDKLLRFGKNEWLTEIEERFSCTAWGNRYANSAQVQELARKE